MDADPKYRATGSSDLPRVGMFALLSRDEEAQAKSIQVEGDPDVLRKLTEHLVAYEFFFNIVEP